MGRPRSVEDPGVFHHVSLVAFLAWVGLGADGLSSSSYGPEESFKALGAHVALAPFLALATAFTVVIIAAAYSRIIEHFPFGGGGYVVATRLLGPTAGVISGSALMVDYVLTITTSVAGGADAIFSFVPPALQGWKLPVEFLAIGVLVVLNLRGVRESVTVLAPIFLLFLVTHVVLIGGAVICRVDEVQVVTDQVQERALAGDGDPGRWAGCSPSSCAPTRWARGTYTGIEAVSNGLQIMREPKVETAKRTMVLMAISLALTAGGITLGYLLLHVTPGHRADDERGARRPVRRRLPALGAAGGPVVRVDHPRLGGAAALRRRAGRASSTGPRVMANMAVDSWAPHRFAQLSDRLTMQNGVLLMGGSSLAGPALHPRRHHHPGHAVRDQRLRHLLAQPAGDVPLLVARAAEHGRTGGARSPSTWWAWCSASASWW